MLGNQCREWPGPIAASVYVPTHKGRVYCLDEPSADRQPLGHAIERISGFFRAMQANGALRLASS